MAQVSRTTSQQGTENLAQKQSKINYDDDEMNVINEQHLYYCFFMTIWQSDARKIP